MFYFFSQINYGKIILILRGSDFVNNRTEELMIRLSPKERNFIIKSAIDKCLSIEDFIMLSALSVDITQNSKQKSLNGKKQYIMSYTVK